MFVCLLGFNVRMPTLLLAFFREMESQQHGPMQHFRVHTLFEPISGFRNEVQC